MNFALYLLGRTTTEYAFVYFSNSKNLQITLVIFNRRPHVMTTISLGDIKAFVIPWHFLLNFAYFLESCLFVLLYIILENKCLLLHHVLID